MNGHCDACRWWDREEIPGQDNDKRAGYCRRYPPDIRGNPVTMAKDWCGEWAERRDGA